jgi:transposase
MGNYHGRRKPDPVRDAEMARLYRGGMKCAEIAPMFGLTRSAVSLIFRNMGQKRPSSAKDIAFAAKYGYDQSLFESGAQMRLAHKRFIQQRCRAHDRAVAWELTLQEWWEIWTLSGQWAARGRSCAESAVMSRRGDIGPYSKGNVYITTLAANFAESWKSAPNRFAHRRLSRSESVKANDVSACPNGRVITAHKSCAEMFHAV